jgi:hypothetical protein
MIHKKLLLFRFQHFQTGFVELFLFVFERCSRLFILLVCFFSQVGFPGFSCACPSLAASFCRIVSLFCFRVCPLLCNTLSERTGGDCENAFYVNFLGNGQRPLRCPYLASATSRLSSKAADSPYIKSLSPRRARYFIFISISIISMASRIPTPPPNLFSSGHSRRCSPPLNGSLRVPYPCKKPFW